MPDWQWIGSFLDVCAVYLTTQLVRCAAFSFVLIGLVMLFWKVLFSERTFLKGMLWTVFLITPFLGKLRLFLLKMQPYDSGREFQRAASAGSGETYPIFSFRTISPLSNLPPLNVIEEVAQIRLKKSGCFSIMEPWQKRESDGISAIYS